MCGGHPLIKRAKFSHRISTVLVVLSTAGGALLRAEDWPQWRGTNRDGVWHESGIIDAFPKSSLDIVWRAKIASGYCGPTVADGRVFVSDRVVKPNQVERVHCFEAKMGKPLWTYTYDCTYSGVQYDAGPRASITIDSGRAFSLGSMGHFFAFEAESGNVLWQHDLNVKYKIRMPVWGISGAPLVERNLVIVQIGGEGDACIVAFDVKTGKEAWRSLRDGPSYVAPIAIDQAGKRVVVVYTADNVVGLDPTNGRVLWRYPFPAKQMPIGIATPVFHRDMLFLSNFFDGSLLLKLRQDTLAVEKIWQRAGPSEKQTDALHSIISTPYLRGDHIYGIDSYGELRCLELMTGDRVWESLDVVPKARWATAHFIENGDRVWIFNERGELIISELSPVGFKEISRAKLIEPTLDQLRRRGGVCWSHPAFANRHVFARNGKELVCARLAK